MALTKSRCNDSDHFIGVFLVFCFFFFGLLVAAATLLIFASPPPGLADGAARFFASIVVYPMCPVGERGALSGGGNWLGLTGFVVI